MKNIVVIAAAGKGSRLGVGSPKCLVSLCGRSILEYQLKAFERFDEVRIVVGYEAEHVIDSASALRNDIVFIRNDDYENTTTLQSMYLGAAGLYGKALFTDGDMVFSRDAAVSILAECEKGAEFVCVASEISDTPVYAEVEGGKVTRFSFERKTDYEWANVAYIDCSKLEYNNTHFFVQLQKYLPLKAFEIDRLEVDTPSDFVMAGEFIRQFPKKFDFWRQANDLPLSSS